MDPAKQPGIEIGQIVLERAYFEHRADYPSLPHSTPLGSLPLRIEAHLGLNEDKSAGIIRVVLTTDRTQNPLYVIEVTMAALVSVKEAEQNMPIERYAMTAGIAMLFPFVREVVANLTSRGRFGPVWLHPFNVAAGVEQTGVHMTTRISTAKT